MPPAPTYVSVVVMLILALIGATSGRLALAGVGPDQVEDGLALSGERIHR